MIPEERNHDRPESIVRFIEDNGLGRQRILGSFDKPAGPLTSMFVFGEPSDRRLILDENTGEVKSH